jgi:Sec-independent protein translocase protein (TatC)
MLGGARTPAAGRLQRTTIVAVETSRTSCVQQTLDLKKRHRPGSYRNRRNMTAYRHKTWMPEATAAGHCGFLAQSMPPVKWARLMRGVLGPIRRPCYLVPMLCVGTSLSDGHVFAGADTWTVQSRPPRHERAYVYRLLPHSLGLFLAGFFLCYFAVLPVTLRFLLEFNVWLGVTPMLRLSEWMGFATILPVLFGLCFQTPLVMLFLSRIGMFTAADYRAKRRPAILIVTIVPTVLTPGIDVSSMLFLSIPMILLYELGILLVRETRPARAG